MTQFASRNEFFFKCGRTLEVLILVLLAGFACTPPADPQSEPETLVEKLYAEAKAAEAAGDLASACAKYETILQVSPRLGAAYNNLGALYIRQREYQKAAAVLEKGLKIDPKMPSASALLGVSLYEMGEFTKARTPLEAALRSNPKDDNAELFLANDLIKLDELILAAEHLRKLSQRQPNNSEIWYLLGKVHMKLSEAALIKLNSIDPNSVWAHEISGEMMESMENHDGALLEYKKAVELAPHQPGTHYLLGNDYWALKMWEPAIEQFHLELENDPSNCQARWKMGNIMVEEHAEPEKALAEIDKALTLCPNLMQARVDRARVLLDLDRPAEAVTELDSAEKADPAEPSIHFVLSKAYRALGKTEQAQAELKLFSKLQENGRTSTTDRARQVMQEKEASPPH
jgi:tetratricopeptide (TPR) repeat protein